VDVTSSNNPTTAAALTLDNENLRANSIIILSASQLSARR
jgi:hypothetical protein